MMNNIFEGGQILLSGSVRIYIYIYIYIYTYIITVFVVTKSLCGFVMNQVQYNMESAQYLGYSYFIIIINKYILDLYI